MTDFYFCFPICIPNMIYYIKYHTDGLQGQFLSCGELFSFQVSLRNIKKCIKEMKDQQSGLGSATKLLSTLAPRSDCSFGKTATLIHPIRVPEPSFFNGADLLGSSTPQPHPLTSSTIYWECPVCTVIKSRQLRPRRLRLRGYRGLNGGCLRRAGLSG